MKFESGILLVFLKITDIASNGAVSPRGN